MDHCRELQSFVTDLRSSMETLSKSLWDIRDEDQTVNSRLDTLENRCQSDMAHILSTIEGLKNDLATVKESVDRVQRRQSSGASSHGGRTVARSRSVAITTTTGGGHDSGLQSSPDSSGHRWSRARRSTPSLRQELDNDDDDDGDDASSDELSTGRRPRSRSAAHCSSRSSERAIAQCDLIMSDVLDSETSYCNRLWILQSNICDPLRETSLLTQKDLNVLFPHELKLIYEQHCVFLHKMLQSRDCKGTPSNILANALQSQFDSRGYLASVYADYAESFENMTKLLKDTIQNRPDMISFLNDRFDSRRCKDIEELKDILRSPLDRIAYYADRLKKLSTCSESEQEKQRLQRIVGNLEELDSQMSVKWKRPTDEADHSSSDSSNDRTVRKRYSKKQPKPESLSVLNRADSAARRARSAAALVKRQQQQQQQLETVKLPVKSEQDSLAPKEDGFSTFRPLSRCASETSLKALEEPSDRSKPPKNIDQTCSSSSLLLQTAAARPTVMPISIVEPPTTARRYTAFNLPPQPQPGGLGGYYSPPSPHRSGSLSPPRSVSMKSALKPTKYGKTAASSSSSTASLKNSLAAFFSKRKNEQRFGPVVAGGGGGTPSLNGSWRPYSPGGSSGGGGGGTPNSTLSSAPPGSGISLASNPNVRLLCGTIPRPQFTPSPHQIPRRPGARSYGFDYASSPSRDWIENGNHHQHRRPYQHRQEAEVTNSPLYWWHKEKHEGLQQHDSDFVQV